MSRYIDADLIEECKEIADDSFEWGTYVVKMSAIREIPTADVKPIVYGEWKYKLIHPSHCFSDMEMTCTRCHVVIRRKHGEWFNFCPMCGADMRKESKVE